MPQEGSQDINLNPGDFYFGVAPIRLRTLLGSCVAITLWHPRLRLGGMCHFVLPRRTRPRTGALDGHYADEVMDLFMARLRATGTTPDQYQAKIFGGGSMFELPDTGRAAPTDVFEVAQNNVQSARTLLRQYGFPVVAEHLGGTGHRNIVFDIGSGDVWVRHVDTQL
jgi:chemotaxis protein CheD